MSNYRISNRFRSDDNENKWPSNSGILFLNKIYSRQSLLSNTYKTALEYLSEDEIEDDEGASNNDTTAQSSTIQNNYGAYLVEHPMGLGIVRVGSASTEFGND